MKENEYETKILLAIIKMNFTTFNSILSVILLKLNERMTERGSNI